MYNESYAWLLNLTKSQRERVLRVAGILVRERVCQDKMEAVELLHLRRQAESNQPYRVAR